MKPQTQKKLDDIFSKYVRLKHRTDSGMIMCFVCGKFHSYSHTVLGHFRKRRHLATRYNEDNCHPLCFNCNQEDEESTANYDFAMLNAYSLEKLTEIIDLSNSEVHISESEALTLIEEYKDKIKGLDK